MFHFFPRCKEVVGVNKEEMFVSGVLKDKVKTYGAFTRVGQYNASKYRKKYRKKSTKYFLSNEIRAIHSFKLKYSVHQFEKWEEKIWISGGNFLWDCSCAIIFLYEKLPSSIKNSNLIYLHTNLFLCSSCRVHPALLLKLHLLSVSFRLIMPWHSAKIVSLKDVTRALTQHSMSWNTLNTGLAQAATWTEVWCVSSLPWHKN